MDALCFATNLTSEEWAAWTQAVGTIVAVLAAAGIAIWQSRQQSMLAQNTLKDEMRHERAEQAKSLLALCRCCRHALSVMRNELKDRDTVHRIAEKDLYFDFGDLQVLVTAVNSIPLHALPDSLVHHALILGSAVRQFQHNVTEAIRLHRSIDAKGFDDFFAALDKMTLSLSSSCDEIAKEVERVNRDA